MIETIDKYAQCPDCRENSKNLRARSKRIDWAVDRLAGMELDPLGEDDEIVEINIHHAMWLARMRAGARNQDWDELSLVEKMDTVRSLADWWPKAGVPA